MSEEDIKDELRKAIAMYDDDTWDAKDFAARVMQLIRDEGYRPAFERYMGNVVEMRRLEDKFISDKSLLPKLRKQKERVDNLTIRNLKPMGMSVEDLRKKYVQGLFF